ncbi:6-phosphogluconolactonase [Ornithinicoccus halotolerans]|uniref:6-phosphogluconolactonase n=1 Tax=Ornithinicoccus halotolerans TaxID=1748220 RepID=UPI001295E08F|nr:6-phosphogluconolactonase [Ornithinicoccus halotolerans]
MIVDLPSTTTKDVSKRLVSLRHEVGAMAMGRVLTLLVDVDEEGADGAIATANEATRQHPARIVVLVRGNRRGRDRLDAQIRVGGDAGASEIIVLRMYGALADHAESVVTPLLLPDSPVVAWWPQEPPADMARSPIGQMARRRVTDAAACARPSLQLQRRARHYRPGDTDLAWTRVTRWRAVLAAALDQPPFEPVTQATVVAGEETPQADLIAGWLGHALGVPVERRTDSAGPGLLGVVLERPSGPVELRAEDPDSPVAVLRQAGQPDREVALRRPTLSEGLADELRRLDTDEIFGAALRHSALPVSERQQDGAAGAAEAAAAAPHAGRTTSLQVLADADTLAGAVAAAIRDRLDRAVRQRGEAHLVLTGGSMGNATVRALAALPSTPDLWQQVHVWWGDERFVPEGHEDRNDRQARDAGLERLGVPAGQVHTVPAGTDEADLPQAAEAYARELAAAATAADDVLVPAFDVVLLGLGPDGHLASLFPDRPEVAVSDRTTVPVTDSPKPPPLRVSLTVPALCRARAVWFVVAGEDKAPAVARARAATERSRALPATWVAGTEETAWWLDDAAAGARSG